MVIACCGFDLGFDTWCLCFVVLLGLTLGGFVGFSLLV